MRVQNPSYVADFLLHLGYREQLRPVLKQKNMKSRLTIEVDFDNHNEPVIQIIRQSSDDTRDSILHNFIEKRSQVHRWLRIEYKGEVLDGGSKFHLSPIYPHQLDEEIKLMQAVQLEQSTTQSA